MTLTPKQALSLPTGETIGEATQDDCRAEFARAYSRHKEENAELYPATMTAEDRIGAWLGHDREFKKAVVLLKAYLRQRRL